MQSHNMMLTKRLLTRGSCRAARYMRFDRTVA